MSTLTAPRLRLKTGLDPTSRVNFKNVRGFSFHGMGAFVGTGRTQRAHVYTAASIPVDPEAYKKIDPEKLAHELGVDMCAVNRGRFWMMDEIDFLVGEVQDFHGVEMRWAGDMTGAEMIAQFQSAYVPSLIYRNTNWIFYAGKPVYLLRDPEGATWVLQEFTKDVDPSLAADNLEVLGDNYKELPDGWTFETKILDEDLSLDTSRAGGWAAIIRDEFHCTYQGCGYGADTQCELHPVTGSRRQTPGSPRGLSADQTRGGSPSRAAKGVDDDYDNRGAAQGDTRRTSDREGTADGARALRHRQGGVRHVAGGSRGREDPRRPHAGGVGVHGACADGDATFRSPSWPISGTTRRRRSRGR